MGHITGAVLFVTLLRLKVPVPCGILIMAQTSTWHISETKIFNSVLFCTLMHFCIPNKEVEVMTEMI